ncbi:hypothetical protein Taro_006826 [Colocasia esculenta]|uniref:Uncharacterized protein n=1 Tax=Colocasia esculenta TaxID=4460 RepID=A0A843TYU5_COLES|nr:hypothetical protein [Colocasia esculenta]
MLATSSSHKKLPLSNISVVPYNGRQTYVEGRRLGSVVPHESGQENFSKGTNMESTILASSTVHNKLPMGVPPVVPYNGWQTYVEGRRLGSVVPHESGQENFSKGTNMESTILASSTVHNKLPMGVPPDVPMNERCFPTSTPTNHNYGEANCQVFMSNETLEAINRAETELEFTLADISRESDRQVHLSCEVLEAYSEEMNNSNTNTTTTTFPSNCTLRKTRGPTQETAVTPPKGQKWKCLIIDGQPVGQAACKLAIILGLYARMEGYFPPYKQWKEQSPQSFKDVMKDIMYWERDDKILEAERNKRNRGEDRATHTLGAKSIARHNHDEEKVRLTCVERDITNSSDPCILSPILDIVYKGHHGGYERGRGLGWSRAVPWSKLEATASNESVQHLTHELQNARAEIEAMQKQRL